MNIIEKIKLWYSEYIQHRKQEEVQAWYRRAARYCRIGDEDERPYIFIDDVPIYLISSIPTDGSKLIVNIDDATSIVQAIRELYILAEKNNQRREVANSCY